MCPSHSPDQRRQRSVRRQRIFLLSLFHLSTCVAEFFENNKLLYLCIAQHFEQTKIYMISVQSLNFLATSLSVSILELFCMKTSSVISLLSSIVLFSTQCISSLIFLFTINFLFSNVCMIKPLDTPEESIL